MKKIVTIFDCDPGIDDAFAINYIRKSDIFDVKLISSVAGNVELEHTTRNLRGLVKSLNWDVEVCEGAAKPIMGRQVLASEVHGNNGLGGYEFKDSELAPLSERSAYERMVDILEKSEEKVLIIAVGPLTNIALLLLGRPDLKEKISEITIMGGGIKGGNTTAAAEFNIYADPEAAEIVFKSGIKINMAGLDVTEQANYTREVHEILEKSPLKSNKILTEVMLRSRENLIKNRDGKSNLHDVVAVMYHTNPEIFESEEYFVEVETEGRYTRGMTVADRRSFSTVEKNTNCILNIDDDKFRKILIEVLLSE